MVTGQVRAGKRGKVQRQRAVIILIRHIERSASCHRRAAAWFH